MPDIDTLSIQITSTSTKATTAIQQVIDKLALLNGALNNYTDDSKFVTGMNSLVGGLKSIASAVNSIDLEKLKTFSDTLNSLSKSGTALSKLNYVQSFGQMGNEIQKANAKAERYAKDVMTIFDIPPKHKKEFTDAFKDLFGAKDRSSLMNAEDRIRRMVTDLQKVKYELSDTYKYVRQYLSGTKLYLNQDVMSAWGDSAKSNRATIGIGNTTTKMEEANIYMEELVNHLNRVYGASIDTEHGITGMANALVEFLREEKYVENIHVEFSALCDLFSDLETKILGTATVFDELGKAAQNADDEMYDIDAEGNIILVSKATGEVINKMNELTAATETVKEELQSVTIANPFEGLITGIEALGNLEVPAEKFAGVEVLASSFAKFGKADAANAITIIPQIGQAFAQMAAELANAPQISDNMVRLAEALSQFSRTGGRAAQSSQTFSQIIGKNLLGSLRSIPSALNRSSLSMRKMKDAMARLVSGAGRLVNSFARLISSNKRTSISFTSLAAVIGHVYANFFLLIRGIRLLGKAMSYSSQLTEVQNVVATTFTNMTDKMEDFADTSIRTFGLSELAAKQYASRFQAMGSAMKISSQEVLQANEFITKSLVGQKREVAGVEDSYKDLGNSLADMSINLTKLVSDFASFYDKNFEDVAQDMQAIYTGMTRPLRKYGLDLTQATLKEFALANGLDADISKMTQAEKTMLRYQYVLSRSGKLMNDFAITADTFANVIRVLQQQFLKLGGIIGTALVNTFKPMLIQLRNFLDTFISMVEQALNALGKLLGWQIQIDKVGSTMDEDMEDYADAIDDASGAAKKLKGQLRGIDELNNLTTNNGGGGGGAGSGLIGIDVDDSGLLDFLQITKDYESAVKGWYDFGRRIAKAITEGLNSIDWDTITRKFGNFGTNLANFLNGINDPEMFNTIGRTLSRGFEAIRTAISEFLDVFRFKDLGISLASFFNGLFEDFNAEAWANDIGRIFGGLIDLIRGFFDSKEGLDLELIHGKIKTFITGVADAIREELNNINWEDVFEVFNNIGTNIADLLNSVLTRENFATVGKTLINVLNSVFEGIKGLGEEFDFREFGVAIAESINNFFANWKPEEWAETLNTFVNGFFDALSGLFKGNENGNFGLDFKMIFGQIGEFLKNLDWKVWVAAIGVALFEAAKALIPVIGTVLGVIWKALTPLLKVALKELWVTIYPEIEGALMGLAQQGGLIKIVTGVISKIFTSIPKIIGTVFTKVIPGIFTAIFAALGGYSIGNAIAQIAAIIGGDEEAAADAASLSLPAIILRMLGIEWNGELWDEVWNETFDNIRNFFVGIKEDLQNVPEIMSEFKLEWEEFWSGLFDDIGLDKLILLGEDIIAGIKEGFINESGNIDLKEVFENIINAFKNVFGIHSPAKEMEPIGEFIIQGILEGFGLVDFFAEMNTWFEENVLPWFTLEKWTGIFTSIKDALKSVWDETVGVWSTDVNAFFEEKVKPFFTENNWLDILSGVKDAFTKVWGDVTETAKGFFNGLADFVEKFINGVIDGFKALIAAKSILADKTIEFAINHIQVPRFANGGYPTMGSLFWAGEAGAEIVGSMNGKTAVASNGEITGITSAILSTSNAEIEVLKQQNTLLQGILEKEFGISQDDLFKSVRTSAREYTNRTGNYAF